MSNQFLKLRRSAVPGKLPDTASLDYGEIALNTYDGLAFMKKSGSNGAEVVVIGNTTGSFSGSFTGNLIGTASWANNAVSASYAPPQSSITTGSITAKVDINPNELFLIKSGSTVYHQIESNSNASVYSNLFIIKNFTTNQPVLTVSQSIVQFATQSLQPSGIAPNGGFWFTSTNLYVGLDDSLLQEDGSNILQEDNSYIIL